MLSLRLDRKMEHELENESKIRGISKSELIRLSIRNFLGKPKSPSAYELGKDSFGTFSSGTGTLSQQKRKTVSEKIRAKKG